MAGLFDTSTVQMGTTSQGVLSEAQSIQADLAGLLAKLEALNGQWIGDGSTAFSTAKLRYQDANTRLNQALTTIGGLIQQNAARYTSDDANAQSTLTSAGSGFDVPGF
jgi:WXG100 family type VII secretion target